ncbi:MAG: twin-arginine translocase subunit TatB [Rhodospirillaceae bacterium]|nr:twin-arginine translocase subunit TatB [Rhodospirillaceae bacterium]
MFDIGWQELFIVAILGIIVVGPKDLPRALRTIMGLVRKARMLARDFQDGIDEVVREADLDDMKKQIDAISDNDIGKTIENTIDPDGGIASDLNMTEITDNLNKVAKESTAIDDKTPAESPTFGSGSGNEGPFEPEALTPSADVPPDVEDKKDG